MAKASTAGAAVALLLGGSSAASAGVIYSNEFDGGGGDCSFNTGCQSEMALGDVFAAQLFTLGSAATVNGGSFVTLDYDVEEHGSSVNWGFYQADGAGGLPGTHVLSGTSAVVSHSADLDGPGGGLGIFATIRTTFNLPSVALGTGSYYFAVQYVTPYSLSYLTPGLSTRGAAETQDGGQTWAAGYEGFGGVSVALYDTSFPVGGVPEPASWALMIGGFGLAGAVLRRRRAAIVA